MDLKEQHQLGGEIERHWYYRAKSEAILRMLRRVEATQVIDVGAGSGYFSKRLLDSGLARETWCIDPHYPKDSDEEWAGKPVHFRQSYAGGGADLVLMLDVLEHVEDDMALLQTYLRAVKTGTHFLVTVPAFQWLWSGHDVFLGHFRRYTLTELEGLLRAGGLRVVKGAYFFGFLFGLVAATRWLGNLRSSNEVRARSDLRVHHPVVNTLLAQICFLELPVFQWNRVGGLSAICLACKL